MKTYSEIRQIAEKEALHQDSQYDIDNEDMSRKKLWISACIIGYQMGQKQAEKYEDVLKGIGI